MGVAGAGGGGICGLVWRSLESGVSVACCAEGVVHVVDGHVGWAGRSFSCFNDWGLVRGLLRLVVTVDVGEQMLCLDHVIYRSRVVRVIEVSVVMLRGESRPRLPLPSLDSYQASSLTPTLGVAVAVAVAVAGCGLGS